MQNEVGARVRSARKLLGLNQEEFGRRLGVKGTAVSKIENSENQLTDQMRLSICREFGIDYEWLASGAGEPFANDAESIGVLIDAAMSGEKEIARAVFKALARLGGEEWETLKRVVLEVAKELESD